MIQQVLNKQLLIDVLDSMRTQAQASAADGRRASPDTPFDSLGPAERTDILEGIARDEEFLAKEGKGGARTRRNRRG